MKGIKFTVLQLITSLNERFTCTTLSSVHVTTSMIQSLPLLTPSKEDQEGGKKHLI